MTIKGQPLQWMHVDAGWFICGQQIKEIMRHTTFGYRPWHLIWKDSGEADFLSK